MAITNHLLPEARATRPFSEKPTESIGEFIASPIEVSKCYSTRTAQCDTFEKASTFINGALAALRLPHPVQVMSFPELSGGKSGITLQFADGPVISFFQNRREHDEWWTNQFQAHGELMTLRDLLCLTLDNYIKDNWNEAGLTPMQRDIIERLYSEP